MSTHAPPVALQRCHCTVRSGNGLPDQLPVNADRLFPTPAGRPEIVGLIVFVGLLLRIAPVGLESAGALLPTVFVAVTRTRSVRVAPASPSVYVESVAPPMFPQLTPAESQRRHW